MSYLERWIKRLNLESLWGRLQDLAQTVESQ